MSRTCAILSNVSQKETGPTPLLQRLREPGTPSIGLRAVESRLTRGSALRFQSQVIRGATFGIVKL
jgi:hypothetical protein